VYDATPSPPSISLSLASPLSPVTPKVPGICTLRVPAAAIAAPIPAPSGGSCCCFFVYFVRVGLDIDVVRDLSMRLGQCQYLYVCTGKAELVSVFLYCCTSRSRHRCSKRSPYAPRSAGVSICTFVLVKMSWCQYLYCCTRRSRHRCSERLLYAPRSAGVSICTFVLVKQVN
jgi:hypothetical protein